VPGSDARLLALSRDLGARGQERYHWYSTQEQIALARLGKQMISDIERNRTFQGQLTLAGKTTVIAPDRFDSRRFEYADLAAGVRYALQSEGEVYAVVDVAGIPRSRPAPSSGKLRINRSYYKMDGSLWKGGSLREGQSLIAELQIESGDNVPDALVVDLLPAGLEIENLNLVPSEQWKDVKVDGVSLDARSEEASVVHEEFRDDRYVAALKLSDGNAKLFYLVRAVTPGSYVVPSPQVEDMYRPELRAVGKAFPETITVVEP